MANGREGAGRTPSMASRLRYLVQAYMAVCVDGRRGCGKVMYGGGGVAGRTPWRVDSNTWCRRCRSHSTATRF